MKSGDIIGKGGLLISIIDAAVVALAFILTTVYLNYEEYTRWGIYDCHVETSFGFDIAEVSGTGEKLQRK